MANVLVDASTPAVATGTGTGALASASFSPPANSYLVAIVIGMYAPAATAMATSVTDSAAGTWTKLVEATNSINYNGVVTVWGRAVAAAPGAITVTANYTGLTGGRYLAVEVLTNVASTPTGATAVYNGGAASTTDTASITTTRAGSLVFGGVDDAATSAAFTANAATTALSPFVNSTDVCSAAAVRATAVTGTPGATALGGTWSAADATLLALVEILPPSGPNTIAAAGTVGSTLGVSASAFVVRPVSATVGSTLADGPTATLLVQSQATVASSLSVNASGTETVTPAATVSSSLTVAATGLLNPLTVNSVSGVVANAATVQFIRATIGSTLGVNPVPIVAIPAAGSISSTLAVAATGTRAVTPTAVISSQLGVAGSAIVLAMGAATVASTLTVQASASARAGGSLVVAAWAVDRTAGALAPLPHYLKLSVSPVRNAPGAFTMEYPAYGKNFKLLHDNIVNDRDTEIEVWLGGSNKSALRFVCNQATGNDVAEDSLFVFAGPDLIGRLDQALVYPQPIAQNANQELVFTSANAGAIMATVLQQAQARGALSDFTRDFTPTVDSSNLAWPTVVNITFSPNTTLLQVIQKLHDLNMCDFRVTAGKVLQMYAPGQLGVDRTTQPVRPVTFRRGVNLTEAPRKWTVANSGTVLNIAGAQGVYKEAADATALARRGRRIELAGSANNLTDVNTVSAYAQTALQTVTPGVMEVSHGLTLTYGDPRPQLNFDVGDYVWSDTRGYLEKLRVVQWVLSVDVNGPTCSVVLNDKIEDRIERLKRSLALLSSGATVVGTSNLPPVPDTDLPAAPSTPVVSSVAYNDGLGNTKATIQASWTAVTTDASGTAINDVASYRVEYAYATAPTAWILGAVANSATTVSISFGGVNAGVSVNVRVNATDQNGNTSAWSPSSNLVTNNNTTLPPVPSTPVVSAGLSILKVDWDGLGSSGQQMGISFDHVEIHMSTAASFTPSATTYLDVLFAGGTYPVTLTPANAALSYGTTYYFLLVAVDRTTPTPLKSGPSGIGSGTPNQVVSQDLFVNCVGTAALASLAVKTANIDNAAVNDLQVGNVSAGKITTGILTANLTLSGIIRTATTGARAEIDAAGIRLYDSGGTNTVNLKATDGSALVTGQYQTAMTGARMVINEGGSSPASFRLYPPTGTGFAEFRVVTRSSATAALEMSADGTNSGIIGLYDNEAFVKWGSAGTTPVSYSAVSCGQLGTSWWGPSMAIEVRSQFANDGGARRFEFRNRDASGTLLAGPNIHYLVTTANQAQFYNPPNDLGLTWANNSTIGLYVGNSAGGGRPITASQFLTASSRKVKKGEKPIVFGARRALDVVAAVEGKSWNYDHENTTGAPLPRQFEQRDERRTPDGALVMVNGQPVVDVTTLSGAQDMPAAPHFFPIAEDLQLVAPDLVNVTPEIPGGLTVNVSNLVGVLWQAMRELRAEVAALTPKPATKP